MGCLTNLKPRSFPGGTLGRVEERSAILRAQSAHIAGVLEEPVVLRDWISDPTLVTSQNEKSGLLCYKISLQT